MPNTSFSTAAERYISLRTAVSSLFNQCLSSERAATRECVQSSTPRTLQAGVPLNQNGLETQYKAVA